MGRIMIFTGKGGVGKSSIAAAHALASAKEGKKTLLISVDMAHNLGDIFNCILGNQITKIGEHLDALEVDPEEVKRELFPDVKNTIMTVAGNSGIAFHQWKDSFSLPGLSNLFSLLKIREIYHSNKYERIIVDCPPTGETIALLKLPELLAWYMEKFFPIGKWMSRVLSPISKAKYGVRFPKRSTLDTIEMMHQNLIELQELLKNPKICSVRLVCVPEKMIVEETKRNFMYLHLYRYHVDALFINRVLEETNENSFLQHWSTIQKQYLKELEVSFCNIPRIQIPWYAKELLGKSAIEALAEHISKNFSMFSLHKPIENEEYIACSDGYILEIHLPGAKEEELSVYTHNSDVNIKLHNFHRCIPLPNILRGSKIIDTKLENDILHIHFQLADMQRGDNH